MGYPRQRSNSVIVNEYTCGLNIIDIYLFAEELMASIKVNLSGGRGAKPWDLFRGDGLVAEKPHLSSNDCFLKAGFFKYLAA